MRRFFFLSAMVLSVWIAAIAGINEKLSASTQLFIAERNGEISLDVQLPGPKLQSRAPLLRTQPVERYIARSERVNGVEMVPAFIHINPRFATKLESFGVVIQGRFDNQVTALIPVDKIERIAEIAEVQEVDVARQMKKLTDKARYYTNTDDVLNYSSSAVQAGLPQAFRGDGVVVGVIDGGIDFQHNMFKDANGNYRIKRAYIAKGSDELEEYVTFTSLTTDDTAESHGTHTSSTAAGSEITVNGVTYGGMAPEADLVLVGLGNYMYNTNIANAIQKICDYADSQNEPAVISISLGSHNGPHDGTGSLASVYSQYGGSHSNHIIVNAAGNEAGYGNYYGYVYSGGEATSSKPFSTVINGYASNSQNQQYYGYDIFYARTAGRKVACKLHVVNTSTNQVVWTSSAITSSTTSVSGITTYFSSSPRVTITRNSYNNKYYVELYTNCSKKSSYTNSNYALAISVYPTSGTCMIDSWDLNGYNYFAKYSKTIGDYTFVSGSDDCSIGDEAASEDLISVGAYVSKTSVKDYNGTNHSLTGIYTLSRIAYFSSYQAPGAGPTGVAKPDICGPGATIVAGINHYDTNGYMANAFASDYMYLVYKNGESSLGSMDGTSMSTPCVAGIIALYLQAAKSVGKSLNTAGIRDVFANSAIHDNNTTNVAFGPYGKIDALAGIQYILDSEPLPVPSLAVDSTSLSFNGSIVGKTYTKTFTLTGTDLIGNVILAVTGNAYSVSPTTISAEDAAAGATVTVTYAPTAAGTATGKVTASTAGGNNVTVSLSGTATVVPTLTVTPDALSFSTNVGTPVTQTFTLKGTNLTGGVYLECSGAGFSINKTNATKTAAMNGVEVTATYNPSTAGNHTGRVLLRSAGADTVYVQLSGTAVAPKYDPVMQAANPANVTTNSFRADWTDATMASMVASYTLEVGTNFATTLGNLMATETGDANHRLVTDIPSSQHYYNVANLNAGGAYVYRVKALYTDGTESNWSNVQQVTLLQGHGYQLGDVNHDGSVTISDVTALIDYLLAGDGAASGCAICGDVNESGDVTIADVTALIDMLLSTPSATRGYGVLLK